MNDILVSVVCVTYNHSKYIAQTLDGFVSQKTDFKYEVIVHDDASTDNTAEIVRSYEEKYPDIIKGIYQTENQYSKRIGITSHYIAPVISGKYVATCEGDDYWTDTDKLQKQVSAMESHPECCLCVHKTKEIKANGEDTGVIFPKTDIGSGVIDSREFLKLCRSYSFHTSSYMFRAKEWKEYIFAPLQFKKLSSVGDEAYMLYFGQLASVYYVSDCMSAYRRGVEGSWNQRNLKSVDGDRLAKYQKSMIDAFCSFDEYTEYKYHDIMVPRIASAMLKHALLTRSSKDMLKKQNREYFKALSRKKKISLVVASVFPRAALGAYKRRQKRLYRSKGY